VRALEYGFGPRAQEDNLDVALESMLALQGKSALKSLGGMSWATRASTTIERTGS
jgi:hypothetical protein